MYLGNIQFHQVEESVGYKLNEQDRAIWDEYHSDRADLSEKPSCFHIFDIPRCIHFRGEAAKNAILKMFTADKITNPVGTFKVMEV